MDMPPEDVDLTKGIERWPALPVTKRWKKRFERAALEVEYLFDRSTRRRKLEGFKEKWSIEEHEVKAFRLAMREFEQRYTHSPITAMQAINLVFLPKDMNRRARIYQLHAAFKEMVEKHRAQSQLPPRDYPTPPPPSP